MNPHKTKRLTFSILTLIVCCIIALLILLLNLSYPRHYHFSLLAHAFIQGKSYFFEGLYGMRVGDFFMHDAALYRGHYFWPLGPFPSVLLMPFAAMPWRLIVPTPEGILNLAAVAGSIYYLIRILETWFNGFRDRVILTLAFVAGSPFLYVALTPKSWFVAQSIVVMLFLMTFHEYLNKRRYWYIGLLMGLILATRVTAAIGILFFIVEIIRDHRNHPRMLFKKLISITIPPLLVALSLASYNFARFDSVFEQGYSYQLIAGQLSSQRTLGLFSLNHVHTNLYYLLLAPPKFLSMPEQASLRFPFIKADPWGMSILITSPYLLYFALHSPTTRLTKLLLIVSFLVLIPILFYYGVGFYQFGYRYILDCFPFIFLAFVIEYHNNLPEISKSMTALITSSAVLNLFFVLTLLCTKLLCEL